MASSRILFFSHSSELSGAPKCLVELVENINRSNYFPIVATPEDGQLFESLREIGIQVKKIKRIKSLYPRGDNLLLRFFFLLRRAILNFYLTCSTYQLIKNSKAELVYLNSFASRFAGVSAKLSGLPVIWHIHEGYQERARRYLFSSLVRWVATKVIFTSKANESLWGFGKLKGKGICVYNGIDIKRVEKLSKMKVEIDFEQSKPLIGYIGQINPFKGINILLVAMEKIKEKFSEATCWIIGKPSPHQEGYAEKLKDEVKRKGLERNVKFIGFQPNIFPLLAQLDILVFPSLYETFGRVLIEGMAMAKPVVATRVGGIPEVVIDGKTGILVPPNNAEKLTEAILILLENPDLRLSLGEEGQKRVKEFFSLKNYSTRIENLIAELLETK